VVGLAVALVVLVAGGCSVRRIDRGVYHSSKGYRVTIPGPDWQVVDRTRADLELRHRSGEAGLLVQATCDAEITRRSPAALRHALLAGLRERTILASEEASVAGRPATRIVLEARSEAGGPEIRMEVLTVPGPRCVYDLMYAAPPASFEARHADFRRLAASFTVE
jgi:hypothetical protein